MDAYHVWFKQSCPVMQAAAKAATLRVSQLEDAARIASKDEGAAAQEAQLLLQQVNQLKAALEKSKKHASDVNLQVEHLPY